MKLKMVIAVSLITIIVPSVYSYPYPVFDRSSGDPNFDMFGRSVAGDNGFSRPLRTLQSPAPMVPRPMPPQRPMYPPPRAPMRPVMRPTAGVLQTQPVMPQPMPYHPHHHHYYPGYDPPSYDPPDISPPDPPSEYYYPRPNLGVYNPSRITAFNRAYLR